MIVTLLYPSEGTERTFSGIEQVRTDYGDKNSQSLKVEFTDE